MRSFDLLGIPSSIERSHRYSSAFNFGELQRRQRAIISNYDTMAGLPHISIERLCFYKSSYLVALRPSTIAASITPFSCAFVNAQIVKIVPVSLLIVVSIFAYIVSIWSVPLVILLLPMLQTISSSAVAIE